MDAYVGVVDAGEGWLGVRCCDERRCKMLHQASSGRGTE